MHPSQVTNSRAQDGRETGASGSFWRAAAGLVAANGLVWGFNRFVHDYRWTHVGTASWWRNVRGGLRWDDNKLVMNQLWHPVHGSMYHAAARANGYSFWSSALFTLAGSFVWEMMGETITPSINDMVSTTLGGMAVGEVSHRFALGAAGSGRPLVALAISPASMSQWWAAPASLRAHRDGLDTSRDLTSRLVVSYLWPSGASSHRGDRELGAIDFVAEYGDPFGQGLHTPYDAFRVAAGLRFGAPGHFITERVVSELHVSGLLARHLLSHSEHGALVLGVFHSFEYSDMGAFTLGGQGISGGVLYRHRHRAGELRLEGLAVGMILGGTGAEHVEVLRHLSDYGPAVGTSLAATIRWARRELLRLDYSLLWLRGITPDAANHLVRRGAAHVHVPIHGKLGIGASLEWGRRTSRYEDLPQVQRRQLGTRVGVTWVP
jgi:hypothetical protein